MSTAASLLPAAVARLRRAAVADPPRDARLLLAHAMGVDPARLSLHLHDPLPEGAAARFTASLAAREARQPVAQIIGHRLFWGRSFHVTRDVLDPRPETETLVSAALAVPFAHVLDLGTGSGAILLSLLAERPEARGLGADLSAAALDVARGNAAALGLGARAEFVQSDWFSAVAGRFDLIVSNPPYIAADEMPALAPELREWEPHAALSPGGDGLAAYRIIVAQAVRHLHPGGWLMVEIGAAQAEAVMALFVAAEFEQLACLRDMDGRDRVIQGCFAAPET